MEALFPFVQSSAQSFAQPSAQLTLVEFSMEVVDQAKLQMEDLLSS